MVLELLQSPGPPGANTWHLIYCPTIPERVSAAGQLDLDGCNCRDIQPLLPPMRKGK